MPLLSRLAWAGLAKEVTPGVYVPPSLFIPIETLKPEDLTEKVEDASIAGNPTKIRGVYAGVKDANFDMDGLLYPDLCGPFLVALGYADTITGAGPYTHAFKIPASGTQPPTYSLSYFDNVEQRAFTNCMLDELLVKLDAKGAVKYVSKWRGIPSAVQSTSTPAFISTNSYLGWEGQASIGGVSSDRMENLEFVAKRAVESIHTVRNNQNPRAIFAAEAEAQVKAKMLFETNADINQFLNYTQNALLFSLTAPGGGSSPVLTVTLTKTSWHKAPWPEPAGKYMSLHAEIEAIYNATDGGPFQASLVNGTSTAY